MAVRGETFAEEAGGLRHRAHAMHITAKARKHHEDMGCHDGWSTARDPLVEAMTGES